MAIACQTEQGEWIYCPLFCGKELIAWIKAIETFFRKFDIPKEQHVNLASHHIVGEANMWVQRNEDELTCWSWHQFLEALRIEFVLDTSEDATNDSIREKIVKESTNAMDDSDDTTPEQGITRLPDNVIENHTGSSATTPICEAPMVPYSNLGVLNGNLCVFNGFTLCNGSLLTASDYIKTANGYVVVPVRGNNTISCPSKRHKGFQHEWRPSISLPYGNMNETVAISNLGDDVGIGPRLSHYNCSVPIQIDFKQYNVVCLLSILRLHIKKNTDVLLLYSCCHRCKFRLLYRFIGDVKGYSVGPDHFMVKSVFHVLVYAYSLTKPLLSCNRAVHCQPTIQQLNACQMIYLRISRFVPDRGKGYDPHIFLVMFSAIRKYKWLVDSAAMQEPYGNHWVDTLSRISVSHECLSSSPFADDLFQIIMCSVIVVQECNCRYYLIVSGKEGGQANGEDTLCIIKEPIAHPSDRCSEQFGSPRRLIEKTIEQEENSWDNACMTVNVHSVGLLVWELHAFFPLKGYSIAARKFQIKVLWLGYVSLKFRMIGLQVGYLCPSCVRTSCYSSMIAWHIHVFSPYKKMIGLVNIWALLNMFSAGFNYMEVLSFMAGEIAWNARLGLLPLGRFDANYIYNSLAVTASLAALNDNVFAMSPWISVAFAYSTSSASVYSILPFKEVKAKIKTMEAASVAAISECLQVLANFSSKHEEAVVLYCCYEMSACAAFLIPKEGEFYVVESSSRTADVKRLLSSRSHIFKHILDNSRNYFYRLDSCVARYVSFLHFILQNCSVIESRCGKYIKFHTTITNATAEELCKDMIRLCIKCFGDAQMLKTYPSLVVGVLGVMYSVSSVVCFDPGGYIGPFVSALPFLVFTVRYIVKYLLLDFSALLDLALLLLLLRSWVQLVIGWDMILPLHADRWVPIYDGEVYCCNKKSSRAETRGPFERCNSFFSYLSKHWTTVDDREDLKMGEQKVLHTRSLRTRIF